MTRKTRILLVEQDPGLRGSLTAALRSAGYAVDVVPSAVEAEARLARQRFTLLISDWRLSDPGPQMSGYVLLTPPRKAARHELLPKPARPAELVEAVERFIGKAIVP